MATKARSKSPARRPRPLSRERIVEAAIQLADDHGDFSMRALGSSLRVDPMAIYRHFRDKDALLDAIVDAVLAGLEAPRADSGTAIEKLRQMCCDLRTAISRHPGIGLRASTTLHTLGPHSLELTEAALDLLVEIGLPPDAAALAYLSLVRFISGTSRAEEHVRSVGQSEREWQEEMRDLYSAVPRDELPHVYELAGTLASRGFDEQFEFGLDALLAGIVDKARGGR